MQLTTIKIQLDLGITNSDWYGKLSDPPHFQTHANICSMQLIYFEASNVKNYCGNSGRSSDFYNLGRFRVHTSIPSVQLMPVIELSVKVFRETFQLQPISA